ncbi:MAG TPA: hypothetical protein DD640_04430 [Clostridiales bacterium]|nr:hypothetical protein [Clostridiales bacterium]
MEDGHLYLIFNNSDTARSAEVTLAAAGHPEVWNPQDGSAAAVGTYQTDSSGTTLTLKFAPQELIPVVIRPAGSAAAAPRQEKLSAEIPVDGWFDFRAEDTTQRPEIAWNFDQEQTGVWHSAALPLQVPERIPAGDWCQFGLATFSGLGHYTKKVSVTELPADARVLLSLGRVAISAEVFVNGESAGLTYFEPYVLDVTRWIKPGENELRIVVANTLSNKMSQYQELAGNGLSMGGDIPERRISGLIGPVKLQIYTAK